MKHNSSTAGSLSYLVCTTPRSGSWLLCNLLESSSVAGRPLEHFHEALLRTANGETFSNFVRTAYDRGRTVNDVFGAKVHRSQFDALARFAGVSAGDDATMLRLLNEELPGLKLIWLVRHDKLRQAISYYRAMATQRWWQTSSSRPDNDRDPEFDFDTIHRLKSWLITQESRWQTCFETFGLDPHAIVYEQLAYDPFGTAAAACQFLGFREKLRFSTPAIVRQADETTEEWVERYNNISVNRPAATSVGAYASVAAANPIELRITALQRSGHHGIISWLAAQCEQPLLYLNDAAPGTNPFVTATVISWLDSSGNAELIAKPSVSPFAHRNGLIISYEDRRLADVFSDGFEQCHDGWLGTSASRRDVLVLRDPFNTFASRMRAGWMRHKMNEENGRRTVLQLWKQYAREAAGLTSVMTHRAVVILFNRWLVDASYRLRIASELGLRFSDVTKNVVSGQYGGSSFDGFGYNGRADEMQLLQRWRHFETDPDYWSLFEDEELLELSCSIFGDLEPAELARSQRSRSALQIAAE